MRIEGKTVYLHREEISDVCPADPRWAVRALQMYGVRSTYKSEILNTAVRCPKILEELGFKVVVEDEDKDGTTEDTTQG